MRQETFGVDSRRPREGPHQERTRGQSAACEDAASPVSRLFFSWFNPLVKLGGQHALNMSDIWALHHNESSDRNYSAFAALWCKEQQRVAALPPVAASQPQPKAGLMRPIWQFIGADLVISAGVLLVGIIVQFARPLLMQQILLSVEGDNNAVVARDQAWVLAVLIAVTAMLDVLSENHYNLIVMCVQSAPYIAASTRTLTVLPADHRKTAIRLRQGLVGLLFSKVPFLF